MARGALGPAGRPCRAGRDVGGGRCRETLEETGARIEVERLVAVGEWLHDTRDVFFVFAARILDGEPAVQPGEVVVEVRWLQPDEADELMPWYPGGVRALLGGRGPHYYVDRS